MATMVSKRYDAAAAKIAPDRQYSLDEAIDLLKAMNIHTPVGKRSFSEQHLRDNSRAVIEAIVRAKPAAAKGTYLKSLTVSSTMSPGVPVDAQAIANLFKKATA